MWYAIQTMANGSKFIFDYGYDARAQLEPFTTREELETHIAKWKKHVTPRMAEETTFEIKQD